VRECGERNKKASTQGSATDDRAIKYLAGFAWRKREGMFWEFTL
jgi:hypothetical protein